MSLKRPDAKTDPRVELVCSSITYEIATGVFKPDEKLPTVRDAVKRWGVDHRIVTRAYKQLEVAGLVRSVPRSGYFVAVGDSHDLISRHRFELQSMFDRVSSEIAQTTSLSTLGAFRYLAQLAEIQARTHPECVFAECTQIQAKGHAAEVSERLSVPCLPMTIEQISAKASRIPKHVRTVLVTGFHFAELKQLGRSKRLNVLSVPIEVDFDFILPEKGCKNIVFEYDEAQAVKMTEAIRTLKRSSACQLKVTKNVDAELTNAFSGKKRPRNLRAYLSPRLWGQAAPRWRKHENVKLIKFKIADSAWPSIADAIALPLGAIDSVRL